MEYIELNEHALQKAHNVWKSTLNEPWALQEDQTEAFKRGTTKAYALNDEDSLCLKKAREALWLSQETVAERLKISRRAYAKLEKNELTGAITLKSFLQAVDALDCEVILTVRPKFKKSFSETIWEKIESAAIKIHNVRLKKRSPNPVILGRIAAQLSTKTEFRKSMGWIRNSEPAPKYPGL